MPERPRALNAILPIVVTVGVTIALLYGTGLRSLQGDNAVPGDDESLWRRWMVVIGAGNSYVALLYGSLSGLGAAFLLVVPQRLLTWKQFQESTLQGASHVLGALGILWLAWALSGISRGAADYAVPSAGGLGTGSFLAGLLSDNVATQMMPTIIFLLSSIVAFSSGTSWGTMALLMPIVITTMAQMTTAGPNEPIMLATVGSVLAGAIFGDHCSPISDTTVLSSQASGCNHVAHVWTQMPYALLVALVSVVFGTIPVGFGVPVWLLLPIGLVVLIVVQRFIGRDATAAA